MSFVSSFFLRSLLSSLKQNLQMELFKPVVRRKVKFYLKYLPVFYESICVSVLPNQFLNKYLVVSSFSLFVFVTNMSQKTRFCSRRYCVFPKVTSLTLLNKVLATKGMISLLD